MLIYLDNNSTTKPYPEVIGAIRRCLTDHYANPYSSHTPGKKASALMEECRSRIKKLLGAGDGTIIFTSCATESNNMVVRGRVALFQKPHVITTNAEHSSICKTCHDLAKEGRCTLSIVPTDHNGVLDPQALAREVRKHAKRLALVSVILANNETGVIQDAHALRKACGRHFLHLDATQLIGKHPVRLSDLDADSVSFGAHKFHGPRIGGLYLRKPNSIRNTCCTGGRSEGGLRSGTPNIAYIVGMKKALEIGLCHLGRKIRHTTSLRNYLQKELMDIPGTKINTADAPLRLCNTLSVVLPIQGKSGELVRFLDKHGICVGVGSACNRNSRSRILSALGLNRTDQQSTLRISLTHGNTKKECDAFLSAIKGFLRTRTIAGQ